MKNLYRFMTAMLMALLLLPGAAMAQDAADEDDQAVYTMRTASGEEIMRFGGRIYVDDEYISKDNMLFRVSSVDDDQKIAIAEEIGPEPDEADAQAVFAEAGAKSQSGDSEKKLICMYSTHSDESYEKGDGTSSKKKGAGIYDVGDELKKQLEEKGIEVVYSKDTFHPHDAGAYRRSRATAAALLKKQPAAVFDLHRDGIPDEGQYTENIDGEDITKVRLLVGRSNPSASANRSFAKQIKKVADKEYPGLIKDIFIGKGNYNQELYPKSVLLEFGTHKSDKDEVMKSTKYMAEVLDKAIFGGSASAEASGGEGAVKADENKASATGIAWFIGIAILAAVGYALLATGTFKGMGFKLGRSVNEITGGIVGKKPDDEDGD